MGKTGISSCRYGVWFYFFFGIWIHKLQQSECGRTILPGIRPQALHMQQNQNYLLTSQNVLSNLSTTVHNTAVTPLVLPSTYHSSNKHYWALYSIILLWVGPSSFLRLLNSRSSYCNNLVQKADLMFRNFRLCTVTYLFIGPP